MQRVGRVVALVLDEMQGSVQEGMSTAALDRVASAALTRYGARSAPQREYGFPGCTCISINDEIVHGVPADRRLRAGDVVKIDVMADLGGYVADAARTVFVGAVTAEAVRLRASAVSALSNALAVARAGRRVSAIGRVIEQRARQDGFAVIRELCGHGVTVL